MRICGDSLVLVGEEPGRLCFGGVVPGSVRVRDCYEACAPGAVIYEEGRDYTLDAASGIVTRTSGSRIPDYAQHVLYGCVGFDHTQYDEYGNHAYFVWVDYETTQGERLAEPNDASALLPQTRRLLQAGGPLTVVAYGDSITAGGEASREGLRYQNRWVEWLCATDGPFPSASIRLLNGATGGDRSHEGVLRLQEKVLDHHPDLVLVAYGMNDLATPIDVFEANLHTILRAVRGQGAEAILLSTFPPNPAWAFASGNSEEIAAATVRVAAETRCAYADVHIVWARVLRRKDLSSLLGNNINHPNDFGHWLYLLALQAVRFW